MRAGTLRYGDEETTMDKINFKSILKFLLIAFFLYAIFTSPVESANIAHTIGDVIRNAFTNLGEFFNALLGKH